LSGGRLATVSEARLYLESRCNFPVHEGDAWWPCSDYVNCWLAVGDFDVRRFGKTSLEMWKMQFPDSNKKVPFKKSMAVVVPTETLSVAPPSSLLPAPPCPAFTAAALPNSFKKILVTSIYPEKDVARWAELILTLRKNTEIFSEIHLLYDAPGPFLLDDIFVELRDVVRTSLWPRSSYHRFSACKVRRGCDLPSSAYTYQDFLNYTLHHTLSRDETGLVVVSNSDILFTPSLNALGAFSASSKKAAVFSRHEVPCEWDVNTTLAIT